MTNFKQILIFFLTMVSGGCGGEVHFVSPHDPLPPAPPLLLRKSEKFFYQKPHGNQMIAFILEPGAHLMRTTLPRVQAALPLFFDVITSDSEYLNDIFFFTARNLFPPDIQKFSDNTNLNRSPHLARNQWLSRISSKGQEFLHSVPIERGGVALAANPIATFKSLIRNFQKSNLKDENTWVHLLYFRHATYPEVEIRSLQSEIKSFTNLTQQFPLSPYRTQIHLISDHTSPSAAHHYGDLFVNEEQIDFFSDDLSEFFIRLGQLINQNNSRMVLSWEPNLKTLEIEISGRPCDRRHVKFDPITRELMIRSSFQPTPQVGDEIKVSYVPKKV